MLKTGARLVLVGLIVVTALGQRELAGVGQSPSPSPVVPVFQVDPTWPKLPDGWVMGIVSSVAVDRRDHVWILHRPQTVEESLKNRAAPPVLQFDADGRFVSAWGGEAQGFDWPDQPHGISIDYKDNVWITGANYTLTPTLSSDDMLLKFTSQGKLLLQIGGRTRNRGNADTKNVNRSSDVFVYPKTNEVFVADGYGNRRVLVLHADTGAFKRMWGAFGNAPEDGPQGLGSNSAPPAPKVTKLDTDGPGSPQFINPLHAIKISNDDLLYVADRGSRRIQVFTPDGKYVTQAFINRAGPSGHSAAGIAFSADPQQQFLYVADYGNSRAVVLNRKTLEVLYQFGSKGAEPGDFRSPHHLATDSKGNLYTAEVSPGNRAQKFRFKGTSSTLPPNALTPAQLSVPQ